MALASCDSGACSLTTHWLPDLWEDPPGRLPQAVGLIGIELVKHLHSIDFMMSELERTKGTTSLSSND